MKITGKTIDLVNLSLPKITQTKLLEESLVSVAEMVAIAVLGLVAVLARGNRLNHTGPVDTANNSAAHVDLGGGTEHEDSEDDEEDELVHGFEA